MGSGTMPGGFDGWSGPSLSGPSGGAQGVQGAQGTAGAQGAQGVAGAQGGSVTDGVTIMGNGTIGSPIADVPAAALTPDMDGYWAAYFQQRTGLDPRLTANFETDFTNQILQPQDYGAFSSGTGALGNTNWNGSAGSGVMTLKAPTAGAGQADWSNAVRTAGPYPQITNMRNKKSIAAYRVACASAPGASTMVCLGFASGANFYGLGFVGAATNWQFVSGTDGAITNVTDTGKAIDSTGNIYLWMYILDLGAGNLLMCIDSVGTGNTEAIATALTNIPTTAGYGYLYNRGAGSAQILNFDGCALCWER